MPRVDLVVQTPLKTTSRGKQLEAVFDVPSADIARVSWSGDVPIEEREWNVGLIVGPSGSGKSTVMRDLFGAATALPWDSDSVIDDFAANLSIENIADACQSVGFNTIPAWLRPYKVLSTGERFRVDVARRMVEAPEGATIIIDEFTSVVDRQVARIASHAIQKSIRRNKQKFVAASCHYDIIEWLQPDWVLEPATMTFSWRSLQRRPDIECTVCRVPYSTWSVFAPFHYLSADLHKAAQCFALFAEDRIAAFAAVLHRPHPAYADLKAISRVVTLPDFQGMGFAMALIDVLGAAYKALGYRLHGSGAHPSWMRTVARSPNWTVIRKAAQRNDVSRSASVGRFGGRPCATVEYRGPAAPDLETARALVAAPPRGVARMRRTRAR